MYLVEAWRCVCGHEWPKDIFTHIACPGCGKDTPNDQLETVWLEDGELERRQREKHDAALRRQAATRGLIYISRKS